jgi:regulator of telomere elongation helicase 1
MWNIIDEVKPIFVEPKRKEEFDECMSDYYNAVKISRGAIFMAVLRGKVSEGLDFKDENGRAVIIIGLPFPPYLDPRVVLKKEYLETNRNKENQLQTGQDWYNMEATRAVNQAIGRVIRHKDDYGAIFLCDQRFNSYKNGLSRWIQSHIKQPATKFTFGPVLGELNKFFRFASTSLPKPVEIKQEPREILSVDDFNAAKVKSESVLNHQIKMENSNEIYGSASNRPQWKQNLGNFFVKNEQPRGFMGGLEKDVKAVDFNSCDASTSSAKQKLSSESLKDYENPIKKRKLKMAQHNESKEVSFVMMIEPVSVQLENYSKPIPENRVEFMNLVSRE